MSDDHPIKISPIGKRVRVTWQGHVVADSRAALELREHVYPPVVYVPREDADMRFFARSVHVTTCPYKGRANYFSLKGPDGVEANAVWTYETPLSGVEAIREHLAFYPDKVEITRGE
jgi:uncharacterized protein (DUF427 family)